jgi:hypothetical protein
MQVVIHLSAAREGFVDVTATVTPLSGCDPIESHQAVESSPVQYTSGSRGVDVEHPVDGAHDDHLSGDPSPYRQRRRQQQQLCALTAAAVSTLTVYDMCKASSKGMVIRDLIVVR